MKRDKSEIQWEAMDAFQEAADRLVVSRSLRALIHAYVECLRLVDQVPDDLRKHFELDQFLVDIAVERTRVLLAA